MVCQTKGMLFVLFILLITVTMTMAQTQRPGLTLSVQGYPGDVPVVQVQGRNLVDVQDLARITNGALSFEAHRIILTPPGCNAAKTSVDDKSGFSRAFMRAAIEAMASIREWGGMLMITVQNGYPVGNTMAGNTVMAYQGRAADSIALASSAASTDSDYRGLELLRNEFNNLQAWADSYVKARSSMSAANISTSEHPLADDQEVQNLVHCGQSLAQMFAGGTFL
ncbi:MAG: hypothetical protein JO187_12290, partial [Acidobacteria bacterium]|nr:hypothetical protein [Acidobacteriota bacterium]